MWFLDCKKNIGAINKRIKKKVIEENSGSDLSGESKVPQDAGCEIEIEENSILLSGQIILELVFASKTERWNPYW